MHVNKEDINIIEYHIRIVQNIQDKLKKNKL